MWGMFHIRVINMFKNKQLFIGILIGILITAFVFPVGAAIEQYTLKKSGVKIVVDGVQFSNENLPVLLMDPGYNYLPSDIPRNLRKAWHQF